MSARAASDRQSHTKRPLSLTPPPLPHRRVKTRHGSLLLRWRGFKNMQVLDWGQWAPQSALLKTISSAGTGDGKKFPGELGGQGQGWPEGVGRHRGHASPLPRSMPPPWSLPCCPRRTSTPSAMGFPSHSPQLTLIQLHPRCPGKIRRLSVPCKFRAFSKNSIASTANQQNQCPQATALPQTQAVVAPADSTSQCTVRFRSPPLFALLQSLPPVFVLPLLFVPFVHPHRPQRCWRSSGSAQPRQPSFQVKVFNHLAPCHPGAEEELQLSTRGGRLTQEDDEDPSQLGTPVLGSSRLMAHPDAGQDRYQQEDSGKTQDGGSDHQCSTRLDIPCWRGKERGFWLFGTREGDLWTKAPVWLAPKTCVEYGREVQSFV